MSMIRNVKRKIWPRVKFKVDPNSTHHDFLVASIEFLMSKTPSDVEIVMIEIGTGGTSSRVMRSYIERFNRTRLISLENDLKWLQTYKQNYATNERHTLVFVENNSWTSAIENALTAAARNARIIAFIDSSPWESRIEALNVLKSKADIFLIHDVDYFPHNKLFGRELTPIEYAPANPFFYGKLKTKNLGLRDYDDLSWYWVEVFPRVPGYFTGPPTLIASATLDVRHVQLPKGALKQSESGKP